jgi:signal transduction histidine kinase
VGAIIREAISNILRHAHARHGRIALTRAPGEVRLEITDDGRGMSTAGSRSSGRHGIKNMRARAACMKAGLSISSKKGPGTTIVLSIPIQDKRRMRGG